VTTSIGWTWVPDGKGGTKIGRTWNPQVGCREVSPACRSCYAAKLAHRGMSEQHRGLTIMRTNAAGESLGVHWNGEINRVPGKLAEPLSWRKPSGIFVGSMTDLFFDVGSDDACRWIAAIFGIMAACPQHTFMVLTKRPVNAAKWFAWAGRLGLDDLQALAYKALPEKTTGKWTCPKRGTTWPLPNVWVGVTAEDQKHADLRVPVLLELPAAVRFVSYEPACGPVDWSAWLPRRDDRLEDERCGWCDSHGVVPGSGCPSLRPDHDAVEKGEDGPECAECGLAYLDEDLCPDCGGTGYVDLPRLDWVICGGESGPGARPSHPDWFRSVRDQCKESGTAFYFKQVGAWAWVDEPEWTHAVFPDGQYQSRAKYAEDSRTPDDGDLECLIEDCDGQTIRNVGAKLAGRELDGRTWDGFPE